MYLGRLLVFGLVVSGTTTLAEEQCPKVPSCFRNDGACSTDLLELNKCCHDPANKVCNPVGDSCPSKCSVPPPPPIPDNVKTCLSTGETCSGVCVVNKCPADAGDLMYHCNGDKSKCSAAITEGRIDPGCYTEDQLLQGAVFTVAKDLNAAKEMYATMFEVSHAEGNDYMGWDISTLKGYNVPVMVQTGFGFNKDCCGGETCDLSFGCTATQSKAFENVCHETHGGVFPCKPPPEADAYCETTEKGGSFQGCGPGNLGCSEACCDVGYKTPNFGASCDVSVKSKNSVKYPLWENVNLMTVTFCPDE